MATCQHCGAFVSLPFKCNYCGGEFCPNCRLPPDHDCAGIGSWKSTSAPHTSAKMDRIHHPELWGTIRPESRSFDDERSDPRFYPPGDSPPDYCRPSISEGRPLYNPTPQPERIGRSSAFQGLRNWLRRKYRDFSYGAWKLWRFARKNWFWILVLCIVAYFYLF
jgi:hypothetical protein